MVSETTLLTVLALYIFGILLASLYGVGTFSVNTVYFLFLVPLFGLCNLLCYVPMLGKMIFRKKQFLHRSVTSDIPGNPHAFDDCIISLMRTLPEPANFNVCFTGIDLTKPLRIEGALPPAVINSLSLYSRTTSDPPVTLDLSTANLSPENRFNVALTSSAHAKSDVAALLAPFNSQDQHKNTGDTGDERSGVDLITFPSHWKGGFLAMRNYAVQNGTRVITPTVFAADGSVLRPPASLVAGLTAAKELNMFKLTRVALFNAMWFCQWKDNEWPLIHRQILVGGLLAGLAFYYLLFWLGKRGLHRYISLICPHMHEFRRPDEGEASEVSQPSQEHRYWLMRYDMSSADMADNDIIVTVPMRVDGQKYWSLTLYDECGLPIPQFVNVFNASYTAPPTDSKISFDEKELNLHIRLTLSPKESVIPSSLASESSSRTGAASRSGFSTVDMTPAPRGYAIFRLVHPTLPTTDQLSVPVASLAKAL